MSRGGGGGGVAFLGTALRREDTEDRGEEEAGSGAHFLRQDAWAPRGGVLESEASKSSSATSSLKARCCVQGAEEFTGLRAVRGKAQQK